MSKVIKNNDGVAVVEGTPAASLVKDVDKFFASKPPERMAGESIFQPRKIDPRAINTRSPIQRRPDPKAINTRSPIRIKPQSERTDEERAANLEAFDRLSEEKKREMTVNTKQPTPKNKPAENFLDFYKSQSSPIFDGKGNVIGYKDGSKGTTEMYDKPIPREEYKDPVSDEPTDSKKPVEDKRRFTGGSKDFNERTGRVEPGFRDSPQRKPVMPSNRNEARDKAESRRKRFFERRRSRKEAVRSQREQEATKGRFITTLKR